MKEYAAVILFMGSPAPENMVGFTHWRLEGGFLIFMWHTQETADRGLAPEKAIAIGTGNIGSFNVVEIKGKKENDE